jgi:hypothetical protein
MDLRRPWRTSSPRSPLRSFALGGLVGAAGAVAAVRRLHRFPGAGQVAGLAAFEDAPCYLERARDEPAGHPGGAERDPD